MADAGAHQADDRVAEGRGLPGLGGEAARVEQRFGDGAVAGARQVAVEGAQGRDQTLALTEGSGGVRGRPCATNRQKRSAASVRCGAVASSGMSAAIGIAPLGGSISQELMIDPVVFDHDVRAVVGIAPHAVAGKIRQRN